MGPKANFILDYYIENLSYNQLVSEPTHEDGNVLDLVFVSDQEIASESEIAVDKSAAALHGWDHYPIEITLSTKSKSAITLYILNNFGYFFFVILFLFCFVFFSEESSLGN